MTMKTTALCLFVATTFACTDAFISSTASLRLQRSASVSSMSGSSCRVVKMKLSEDDFIPSEEWLGEYMGEQGLRYALNKTPKEIETEGDYTLLEKLFGQTSNNKARMDLKAQVLAKVNIPTDPELYKAWTAKYGYGRFFPAYVDKSGYSDGSPAPSPAAAPKAPAPKKAAAAAVKAVTAAVKASPAPKAKGGGFRISLGDNKNVAVAAPKASAPAPAPAPKKPAAPKVAAAPAKPRGNIKNIPKSL